MLPSSFVNHSQLDEILAIVLITQLLSVDYKSLLWCIELQEHVGGTELHFFDLVPVAAKLLVRCEERLQWNQRGGRIADGKWLRLKYF